MRNNPYNWGPVCAVIAVGTIVLSALLIFTPVKAHGAEPYGGCKEASAAPHSAGADWCRQHGWIVTRHTVFRDRLCANLLSAYSPGVRSDAARACRVNGWTIRPHFTIDRYNNLRSAVGMKPCRSEDSNGCYWNANRHNGRGSSFVASFSGEVFYVASW